MAAELSADPCALSPASPQLFVRSPSRCPGRSSFRLSAAASATGSSVQTAELKAS